MSGGGNNGSSTTTQSLDPDLKNAWLSVNQRAQDVASNPFESYGGDRVAGDNDYLAAARDQAAASGRVGQGQLQGASKIFGEVADQSPNLTGAQQFAGTNLDPYMNPYQTSVIDQSNRSIDRNRQIVDDQNAYAASQAGAFGGSRHGIVDAENAKNFGQMQADNTSTLLNAGYDRATTMANADVDRRTNTDQFNVGADERNTALNLQGAQGLAGVGGQMQDSVFKTQAALQQAGQQLQGQDQAQADASYQEFMRKIGEPGQDLNTLLQPFGALPSTASGGTTQSNARSKQVGV